MKQFECIVYDTHGIRQQVNIAALSESEARNKLLLSKYNVVSVKESSGSSSSGLLKTNKLSLEQLEFFSAQMALLLGNGLKLDEALELLQKVAAESHVKFVVGRLLNTVREGHPLSSALDEKWGFDRLYISLVKIGESSGNITEVFEGIASDLKFKKALSAKVKQAISYPVLVFIFCIAAVLFVFNVVIPRMSVLFDSQDALPWYTVAMLNTADFVTTYQYAFIPLVALISFLLFQLKSRPKLNAFVDKSLISLPLISALAKNIDRIRYCSAMHLTLKSGISVERAMMFSAEVVKNGIFRRQLLAAENKVRQGSALANAFRQTLLFDEMHTGLIEVGEKSGDLEVIFKEITEREQVNFDSLVTRFTALLEPVLILLMAGIVGSVVVVMLMSIIAIQDVGF